jgi:hypothetical protein
MKQARHLLFAFLLLATLNTHAQVAIGTPTPDVSAQLDITSTARGLLIPRMTAAQRTAIVTPAAGLLVYQTDATAGIYVFSSGVWTIIGVTAGPQGAIGPMGPQGPAGNDGAITFVGVPATPTSTGIVGQQAYDNGNNLMYICVATDTWVRFTPVATW